MIRTIEQSDFEELKRIWLKFYQGEFEFPDFLNKYICAFVVVHDDKIVSAGGVRTIAESVIITDKDISVRDRGEALYQILEASKFVATRSGYNYLNAFVKDDLKWRKRLLKVGFVPSEVLSLEL